MQHKQQNYRFSTGGALLMKAMVMAAAILPGSQAQAAGIVHRGAPDPLLRGTAGGPCDPKLGAADYVAGVDVDGNAVAPADMAHPKVPVPGTMFAQTGGRDIALDSKALDPLLNPKSACPKDSAKPGTR